MARAKETGMSQQELLELKGWGHQLIMVLMEKRKITKDEVYNLVSMELGIKEKYCHFGRANAEQTQKLVNALIHLSKKKKKSKKKSEAKKLYKELKVANKSVSQDIIKAAIAALPKRKPSLWHRIKRLIHL